MVTPVKPYWYFGLEQHLRNRRPATIKDIDDGANAYPLAREVDNV
jgi:hypothetical protein